MEAAKARVSEAEELAKQPGCLHAALKTVGEAIGALEVLPAAVPATIGQEPAEETRALAHALVVSGELELALGRASAAALLLKRARDLHSTTRSVAAYAAALGASGNTQEAIPMLEAFDNPAGLAIPEMLALGKAYMVLGEDQKGEQLLKSAWARGGDPFELANAQCGKYLKLRTDDKVGEAVDGYKQAIESLKNAARINRKDPRPRFRMGLLYEEPYHHKLVYGGGKRPAGEEGDGGIANEVQSAAFKTWSAAAMEDEILAIGNMHGCWGTPTMEELLQALLTEHRAAVDAGKTSEADTVMVLYAFKSRQLVAQGKKGGSHLKVDKHLQTAAKEYEECIRDNPVPEVMIHLARAQKQMGSYEKASATAKKAAELDGEHAASQLYAALLSQPVDLEGGGLCPEPLAKAAEFISACVDRAVEAGPKISDMLLAEELCHAVNPDLSLAAVAVARAYNAAGKYKEAESICRKLTDLLPECMKNIHWASVLQVELGQLCGSAREELLKALQARQAGEEGVPVYEQLYSLVSQSPGKSVPALQRVVQCCRIGCEFRPTSSEFKVRLAEAIWSLVDNDISFEKKENREKKKETLLEVEALLRASMELEGKPQYEAVATNTLATPTTPEKEEVPKEEPKPEVAVPAAAAAKPASAASKTSASAKPAAKPAISAKTTGTKPAPAKPSAKAAVGARSAPKTPAAVKTPVVKPAPSKASTASSKGASKADSAAPASTKAVEIAAPQKPSAPAPAPSVPKNEKSIKARVDLARVLRELGTMGSFSDETREECIRMYMEARAEQPRNVDACVGIGQLLVDKDPVKAIAEMSKFPDPEGFGDGKHGKPNFDDSFCHVEIARAIIKHATDTKDKELLECEQVEKSLSIAGKVMGWDGIDKWVEILDNRGKWDMLKRIYMAINEDNAELDADMCAGYFTAKGWDPVIVPRRYDVPTK